MLHEQYENEHELLFYNLKDKITDFNSNINQEQFETWLKKIFLQIIRTYFTRNLKENGDLARFWLSFKDRARLMLNPIAATRLGNLYLFLETLKDIISYTSAYSNIKYSRNLRWCSVRYFHWKSNIQECIRNLWKVTSLNNFLIKILLNKWNQTR